MTDILGYPSCSVKCMRYFKERGYCFDKASCLNLINNFGIIINFIYEHIIYLVYRNNRYFDICTREWCPLVFLARY